MKHRITSTLCVLFAWCGFVIGGAVMSVGEIPECSENPYTWSFAFAVAVMVIFPAVVGYLSGRDSKSIE